MRSAPEVDLRYLPDEDAVVETVARWHQDQWGHLTGRSVQARVAEFAQQRESRSIPLTVVAFADGAPIGNASLLAQDMDTHPDLSPWLASVYVAPERRRLGIGERLCRRIVAEAARLKLPRLYLFTEDRAAFYARLGWRSLGEEHYHGEAVTLMAYDLDHAARVS